VWTAADIEKFKTNVRNEINRRKEETEMTVAKAASRTLDEAATRRIQAVEVEHHEGKLMIPNMLSLEDARDAIQGRIDHLSKEIKIVETVNAFPWDAAIALAHVVKERFGWQPSSSASINVEVGYQQTAYAPWGTFKISGVEATFISDVGDEKGLMVARYFVVCKGRDEHVVRSIFADTRKYLETNSIYRGKAFQIVFHDKDGEKLAIPEITFIDLSKVDPSKLIYPKHIYDSVETSIFTPITRVKELAANGIPIKRATLLAGKYGTGKTLAAAVAAKLAVGVGMTYIYVPHAREIADAINFSAPYQDPAVLIFVEDIDREMSGERDEQTDVVLNTIDGVTSKDRAIMMVLTTNDIDSIEPALLRPGRLDAVIEIMPPDAEAAARLVKSYGGDTLAASIDLTKCGVALAGLIPAVIAEVLQRAKLAQLKATPRGHAVEGINTDAVVEAAGTMRRQLQLIDRAPPVPMPWEEAAAIVGDALAGDPNDIAKRRAA
jgi:hypothetical protein